MARGPAQWGRTRGLFIESIRLGELGQSPVRQILARSRVGEHLFSLEILPDDLPSAALDRPTAVADLNIHRDTFRDERVGLLLWVPRSLARRFLELASNLADYRTVDLDVPSFPQEDLAVSADAGLPPAPATLHNLPLESLGEQFVGRREEMKLLRETLAATGRGAITDPVALEGLGGIGKTRLVLEYAWQHLGDYDFVFFLRADTPETLRSGLAGLADEPWLALPEAQDAAEEVRLQAVLRWFSQHDRWLLILDNADDESVAEAITRDVLPSLPRGHVLLTSRFRRWGGQVRAVVLGALSQSDAVAMLIDGTEGARRRHTGRCRNGGPPGRRSRLSAAGPGTDRRLGAHPALHVGRGAGGDLRRRPGLAALVRSARTAVSAPVAAVWEQATQRLTPEETFLLRALAWLAPNPVPDFLLLGLDAAWPDSEGPAPDFVTLARSLAQRSILTERRDRSFQLHRLWLELERHRTPGDERPLWDLRLAEALDRATPGEPGDVRNWPRLTLLEPHAAELFRRTEHAWSQGLLDTDRARFAGRLSRLLNHFALFAKGKAQFRRGRAADAPGAGHRRAELRDGAPQRRQRPEQPGPVAPGHQPAGRGRAADAPGAGHRRAELRDGAPQRRQPT